MKKYIFLCFTAITGCASSAGSQYTYQQPVARAPESEVRAANQRNLQCLAYHSAQLDDGRSDAMLIARTVANRCQREREEFFSIASQGWGPMDTSDLKEKLYEKDIEAAAYYILSNRANSK